MNEGANKNSSRKNGNSLHSSDMEEIFGRTNNETTNDLDDIDNSGANRRENKYIYDLFAVCNHKGQNMANGHYTGIYFGNNRIFENEKKISIFLFFST